jgi:hypothetical protein
LDKNAFERLQMASDAAMDDAQDLALGAGHWF